MERVHPKGSNTEEAKRALLSRKMAARRNNIRNAMRKALPLLVAALLVGGVYYLAFVHEPPKTGAPDWKLESHNGVVYDSDDYYKTNKVTLIQFIHTDSNTSQEMAAAMFDVYDNYFNFDKHPENEEKLTKMFTIGGYKLLENWDDMEILHDFRQEHGNWWPFLFDIRHDLMGKYDFKQFPAMALIKNDKVVFRHEGAITRDEMYSQLDRYMGPPPWRLKDTTGQVHDSKDHYNKGLTLVEFMHTECGTCKDMPDELNPIHAKYGSQLNMFTIGGYVLNNHQDTHSTLGNFKAQHGSDWPHLMDDGRELIYDYKFNAYPSFVLIKNNEIVFKHTSFISFEELSEKIDEHL